jgi:hypothetical protein
VSQADGAFRTEDMALAAYLACCGYRYEIERLNSRMAVWAFAEPVGDEMDDQIDAYENYQVRVEPRAYLKEVGRVRSELYAFLNNRAPRRGAPSADTL